MSFEEKSVWVQLLSTVVLLVVYGRVASQMLAAGVSEVMPYIPVLLVTVGLMVAVLIAGFIAVALTGGHEEADERDRLIGWRAEAATSWILAAGVVWAVGALALAWPEAWVAQVLIGTLFAAELARYGVQLWLYRRGT